jgi:hypothetical protein
MSETVSFRQCDAKKFLKINSLVSLSSINRPSDFIISPEAVALLTT